MDNVTHTLAGMLLAEAAAQWRSRAVAPSRSWRRRAFIGSCIANNLPDIDFVYTGATGGPLGYLLHHRGHTHTLPIALMLGFATFVLVAARAKFTPRGDRASLLLLCLVGPLVHIAMDFANNYGVHPFWPLHDGWFYGDAVFIVEPWFWVAGIPPLAWAMHHRLTRVVLWSLLLTIVAAAWTLGVVGREVALALTIGAIVTSGVSFGARPSARIAMGVLGCWLVAFTFALSSARARTLATRSAAASLDVLHDVVLTPMPGDPRCFDALAIGTRGALYVARRATVTPYAPLSPASSDGCRPALAEHPTAPFAAVDDRPTATVRWHLEWAAPVGELTALARRCEVAALLRFVRAPYWVKGEHRTIVGDLRYDRAPGLDFADMALASEPSDCPRAIPPWTPPRAALLER